MSMSIPDHTQYAHDRFIQFKNITLMKKIHLILTGFLIITFGCKKENQYLPTAFNYPIDPVTIKENVNVGAYYFNYSSSDWAKKFTNTPNLGQYSALDPQVMEQHRQWADKGGIDFFIFNWNGSKDNTVLNSFVQGRNSKVKMVITYNTAHLAASNSSPLTGSKLTIMINEFKDLANNFFSKDYYFKIDNRPVVNISQLNLAGNASSSIDYTTVIPAIKKAMNDIGIDIYVIGEVSSGWLPPQRYETATKAMDAVVLNDWSTDNYDRSVFFNSFLDTNWKNWTDSISQWKVDFIPCIFPAFNDKAMSPNSKKYNLDGDTFFKNNCNVAKRNMSVERIVFINSWNNFQLGTALEPTKETGETYLNITKTQFKIN